MAGKTNSRHTQRVTCASPARLEGARGPLRGVCRSLSEGGLYFEGAQLPVGQQIALAVELPRLGRIEAVGEVRYHHASPQGTGMGLRFTRLGQDSLARIQRYVQGGAAAAP
jgi:hypothetical protein